ncbi:hypothetical protein DSO57_1038245 [Entomophthora muscae]|uniref:Uncharacterized protein n=1 Tax=Entomophthora muscae TaxID=34485 RepID=A0ACC2RPM9_9FUNG|nr:hypothetical protein DSO57_1038245 [Entomophthora muscae]
MLIKLIADFLGLDVLLRSIQIIEVFREGIPENSTQTCLCICQVPEPMWVTTASRRLTVPAAVWFTNWASQEQYVTWAMFMNASKSCYSETFSLIVNGSSPIFANGFL